MKRPHGFTLIELTVVVCIVAVLFGVALERLLRYQELGERTAMELNLNAINSALAMRFAALYLKGGREAVEADSGRNPIEFLRRPPENYLGELFEPALASLPRRSWYFDLATRELVYLPDRRRYLSSDSGPPELIRFRVDPGGVLSDSAGLRELRPPLVGPVRPFKWEIGSSLVIPISTTPKAMLGFRTPLQITDLSTGSV